MVTVRARAAALQDTTPPPLVMSVENEDIQEWKKQLNPNEFWTLVTKHTSATGAADFSWALAVEELGGRDKSHVLERLNQHRRRYWKGLKHIIESGCAPFCNVIETGTISPSSDIDITLTQMRSLQTLRLANKLTEKVYGKGASLSQTFDINIYAHAWYTSCGHFMALVEDCFASFRDLTRETYANQLMWAMVRIRKEYMRKQRSPYAKEIWDAVPEAWKRPVRHLVTRLAGVQTRSGAHAFQNSVRAMEDAQLQIQSDTLKYLDATSQVAYFSNDAYYSVGAYLHIVARMQKGREDLDLAPELYLMSFLDNLGFLLTYVGEAGAAGGAGTVAGTGTAVGTLPNPGTLVLQENGKLWKYLYRCADAVRRVDASCLSKRQPTLALLDAWIQAKSAGDRVKKDTSARKLLLPQHLPHVAAIVGWVQEDMLPCMLAALSGRFG